MTLLVPVTVINCALWLCIAQRIATKRKDPLHIANIFIFLFIITYPCKLLLTEYGYSVIDSSLFGQDWQLYALFIANISAGLFVFGALRTSRGAIQRPTDNTKSHNKRPKLQWGWFLGFCFFLVLTYGVDPFTRIFSFSKLQEFMQIRHEFRTGRALSALSNQAFLVCLMLYMKSLLESRTSSPMKLIIVALWAFVSYMLLSVSGSKYTALLPITCFVLLANMKRAKQLRPWSFKRIMLLGGIGLFLLGFFAYLRGFGSLESYDMNSRFLSAFQQFTYAFDGPDNLTAILYRVQNPWFGDLNYAPTIQNVFISPIPRFIWPEKPLVLSNLYIMQHYLFERYTDHLGEVISPSMAGEMIVSGGYLYMSLCSLFLGSIFGYLYRKAMSIRASDLSTVIYTYIALNAYNLLRSGDGVVPSCMYFIAVAIIVIQASKLFSSRKRKKIRVQQPDARAAHSAAERQAMHRYASQRRSNPKSAA